MNGSATSRAPIPEAKITGLRQALERHHFVRFNNGAQVEYEDCPSCKGRGQVPEGGRLPHEDVTWLRCERCQGECSLLRVERPAGGVTRYPLEAIRAAYAMALYGPPPKAQPSGDGAKYGEDAPW